MSQEQINLLEYTYDGKTNVEVPGKLLEGLIQILNTVYQSETKTGFISAYPASAQEEYDKENKEFLTNVKVEWKVYPTAQSYFSQQPQECTSVLGAGAQDLLLLLKQIHLDNINAGNCIKAGTFNEQPKEDVKLT